MHRNILILPLFFLVIFSCSEKQTKPDPLQSEHDPEEAIARGQADTLSLSDTLENKGKITMDEILNAFRYCKETAENKMQCKYFISKAIDDYFGVSDFKVNGNYVDFENILFMVRSNPKWKSLGMAKSQDVLNEAHRIANGGKPVLAIYTASKFGHVVIVLPGKMEKAATWNNLNCPQVASFFMIEDYESFVDKSMAYAWGSPEHIEIFARN